MRGLRERVSGWGCSTDAVYLVTFLFLSAAGATLLPIPRPITTQTEPVEPNVPHDSGLSAPPSPADDPPRDNVTHVIQQGETLWGIAASMGVTVEALQNANGIMDPNMIMEGQSITIPVYDPSPAPYPSGQCFPVGVGGSVAGVIEAHRTFFPDAATAKVVFDASTDLSTNYTVSRLLSDGAYLNVPPEAQVCVAR